MNQSTVELLPPSEAVPDNPKWHELRRMGVTASDIATILGISPWESPFSLFWRKVNGWEIDDNRDMEAGRRLEPVVAGWFADLNPDRAVSPAGLYAHPDRPWQLATPDRLVCDPCPTCQGGTRSVGLYGCEDCRNTGIGSPPLAVLECKHPYNWEGFGDDGSGDIPVHYRAQLLWQIDVVGVDRGYLSAYANHQFRTYVLERDEADLAVMRDAGWDFLRRIEAGEPPDIDDTAATLRTLKRLHPTVEDREVEIPEELAADYLDLRGTVQAATKDLDLIENQIRDLLGSAKRGTANGKPLVTRSVFEQRRIDSRELRADHPDLADDYTKTSTVDKLTCAVRNNP